MSVHQNNSKLLSQVTPQVQRILITPRQTTLWAESNCTIWVTYAVDHYSALSVSGDTRTHSMIARQRLLEFFLWPDGKRVQLSLECSRLKIGACPIANWKFRAQYKADKVAGRSTKLAHAVKLVSSIIIWTLERLLDFLAWLVENDAYTNDLNTNNGHS